MNFKLWFENNEEPLRGSRNFEIRLASGWELGQGKYTGYEPHHQNHGHGSWTYEQMYHPPTEKEYEEFFEKQSIEQLKDVHFKWSQRDGFRLLRNDGGVVNEVKIKTPFNGMEITTGDDPDIMYDAQGRPTEDENEAVDFEYLNATLEWL